MKATFAPTPRASIPHFLHSTITRSKMAELKKNLSLFGLTMVAVGGAIGSGIFRTPGLIVHEVHRPELVMAVWCLGGLVALTGALTFAELGGMFPGAGGLYVYLKKAFGERAGFLFGWYILLCANTGAIAGLSLVCAEHVDKLWPLGGETGKLVFALSIMLFVTVLNVFGAKLGEWFGSLTSLAKLAGIAFLVVVGFLFAAPPERMAVIDTAYLDRPASLVSAFAAAFMGVMWSFGGWHHASFLSGETQNPQRNVPRAMVFGALIITVAYLLCNAAYLRLLPVDRLGESQTVAADAIGGAFPWGGRLVAALIAVSTFGSMGIYFLSAPRIYHAMAVDGLFFKGIARVHPRWRTPVNAILIQFVWAAFLLFFWGKFSDLMGYVTFIDFVGTWFVALSIFVFRKKMPDATRPYRTNLYPLTPLVFLVLVGWFLAYTLVGQPKQAWAGLIVVGVGAVVYELVFKKKV